MAEVDQPLVAGARPTFDALSTPHGALNTRIAIAQVRMHWTLEENLDAIHHAMQLAKQQGAAICAFSELAVTGFHREIASLARPEIVAPAIESIRHLSARLELAVAVGAPTFGDDGAKYITHLLIDDDGLVTAAVSKQGLTDPEATFFARGTSRPLGRLKGLRCTAVICREVGDFSRVTVEVPPGSADLIFVPGALRQDPALPFADPPAYVDDMRALAQATGAYVVQTNWPNALNRPEESADAGRSGVVCPAGELLFRLPKEASGIGVFNLGERSYQWWPQ